MGVPRHRRRTVLPSRSACGPLAAQATARMATGRGIHPREQAADVVDSICADWAVPAASSAEEPGAIGNCTDSAGGAVTSVASGSGSPVPTLSFSPNSGGPGRASRFGYRMTPVCPVE